VSRAFGIFGLQIDMSDPSPLWILGSIELEEELEVAQVQLELCHTLAPRVDEAGEVGEQIRFLKTRLFNITEVNQWLLLFFLV
jgi:hypothetical protein